VERQTPSKSIHSGKEIFVSTPKLPSIITHSAPTAFLTIVSLHWGHAYKLFKPRCTASIRSNFFAERVINIWNSLPVSVNFSTLKSFRRTIQSSSGVHGVIPCAFECPF